MRTDNGIQKQTILNGSRIINPLPANTPSPVLSMVNLRCLLSAYNDILLECL